MKLCSLSIVAIWWMDTVNGIIITPRPLSLRRQQQPESNRRFPSCLYRAKHSTRQQQQQGDEAKTDHDDDGQLPEGSVRFLGRGSDAIVRVGCVLVSPSNEFHHYYRRSAIFIYGMGADPDATDDTYLIRGLIIDHPTPFTLAEMMEQNPAVANNPLGGNFLFRGGDKGKEGVILLHDQKDVGQNEIGLSGIHQGGWQAALESCAVDPQKVGNFKSFFNFCEFSENELEDLLNSNDDDDAWISVEVQPNIVLDPDWDRGGAWSRLRNTLKQMKV